MAESDNVKKDPLEILLNIVGLIWINGSLYLIDTHTHTHTHMHNAYFNISKQNLYHCFKKILPQ